MQREITTEMGLHRAMGVTVWREMAHFGPLKTLSHPGVALDTLTPQFFRRVSLIERSQSERTVIVLEVVHLSALDPGWAQLRSQLL